MPGAGHSARRSFARGHRGVIVGAAVSLALSGCSGDHHILSPKGPEAHRISVLGWGMIITATLICLLVFGLMVAALLPGDRHRLRAVPQRVYLVGGGIVLPTVVLLTLSGLTVTAMNRTGREGTVEIEVTGHQWWWEVRYPGSGAVTANEVHIPAGRPVRLTLRSDDVIHSFWAPALAGKLDLVPGRDNRLVIEADEPGVYRARCAEFCGAQHALMAMEVIAHPQDEFDDWLTHQAEPAAAPDPADARALAGLDTFQADTCASCHTIRGTDADGELGPDLTHLADRRTIGALTLPNDRTHLRDWVQDPQNAKFGAKMPPSELTDEELDDVVAYLEGLR